MFEQMHFDASLNDVYFNVSQKKISFKKKELMMYKQM